MHQHSFSNLEGSSLRDFPEVGVSKCSICGLVVHNRDLSDEVSYESGTMHRWAKGWGGGLKPPISDLQRRSDAISSLMEGSSSQKILDFGCGTGDLVDSLRKLGFTSYGFDPDESAIKINLLNKVVFPDRNTLPLSKFDLISLIHVVEHIYEVVPFLRDLKTMLEPNGLLVIETPNANDALLSLYENTHFSSFTYWSHHPNLCTNLFLEEALLDAGFDVLLSTQIMRYDLANHMHWLAKGLPGGHEKWKEHFSEETKKSYSDDLISRGVADTLWLVAKVGSKSK